MATINELQDLIELIGKVGEASRTKRVKLFDERRIRKIEWELDNQQAVLDYISSVADKAGLSSNQKQQVIDNLKPLLNHPSGNPSVAWLEDKLLDIKNELNIMILDNIIDNISGYKTKIDNASQALKMAIDKLNDISEAFGAIAIAVNLFSSLISAASGDFATLLGVVSKL